MLQQRTPKFWQLANFGSRISVALAPVLMWIWDAICCVYEVADLETFTFCLSFSERLELQTVALLCKSSLFFVLLPGIAWDVISEIWLMLAAHRAGAESSAKHLATWVSWLFRRRGAFLLDGFLLVLLSSCMPSFCFRAVIHRAAAVYPVFFWVRADSPSGTCA